MSTAALRIPRLHESVPHRGVGAWRGGITGLVLVLLFLLGPGFEAAGDLTAQTAPTGPGDLITVEVASVGVDLQSGEPLALLHSGWRELLPVWIGQAEAIAIARALEEVIVPRPMTHDLLLLVMGQLGGVLEEVHVHSIREGTYIGSLYIRVGEGDTSRLEEVDSRPSDALALAVRTGAPIRVSPGLVAQAPDVDFVSMEGDDSIVRIRGVTVRESRGGSEDLPGVLVLHVTTEAEAWGLRSGDVVTAVGDMPTPTAVPFLEAIRRSREEAALDLTVTRDGETLQVRVPPRRAGGRIG